LGDELRFALARAYGTTWLEKPNRLGRLFKKASELANRYGTAYIFYIGIQKGFVLLVLYRLGSPRLVGAVLAY
jgi:hypothetical protein